MLLQGETSVGKTSMIEYIAKASGNRCVRINNHEHTDVQEYTGSYVADELGHLVFKEGEEVAAAIYSMFCLLELDKSLLKAIVSPPHIWSQAN